MLDKNLVEHSASFVRLHAVFGIDDVLDIIVDLVKAHSEIEAERVVVSVSDVDDGRGVVHPNRQDNGPSNVEGFLNRVRTPANVSNPSEDSRSKNPANVDDHHEHG